MEIGQETMMAVARHLDPDLAVGFFDFARLRWAINEQIRRWGERA